MNNLDYGIIGNCTSAALISKYGSIDWCCLPQFDSSSVFAKLLDKNIGGSFGYEVGEEYTISQKYIEKTNILVTLYSNGTDAFESIDFMPRFKQDDGSYYTPTDIIRYIKHISGEPKVKVIYNPKLNYAEGETVQEIKNDYIVSSTTRGHYDSVYLYSDFDLEKVMAKEELSITQDHYFLIAYHEKLFSQSVSRCYLQMQRTRVYWLNWSDKTPSYNDYDAQILRSALVLKLLTYEKSGAVLAAATTSLPETIGEVRNWDYRFCWIRDASMVIRVVTELGHTNVAQRFLQFVLDTIPDKDEPIQIMYGINGEKNLTENFLDHLAGYEDSSPVRIGNAAYDQTQHDIYGVLVDVIYQQFKRFDCHIDNGEELWSICKGIVSVIENKWQTTDRGIWELRTEERHFTFSKLLCWVAVDRAIKIAELIKMTSYIKDWKKLRKEIYDSIYTNAWNEEIQAYTQSYGSKDLDASTLLMESYGFIEASDYRFISTVKATEKELCQDGLMYRYKNKDDFGLPSSSFTICSFWFIDSLYKIGETKKAKKLFDQLLSYSNHLGLFSEDIHFDTKRLLGNFPQAYSHLALIETAINFSGGYTEEEQIKNIVF